MTNFFNSNNQFIVLSRSDFLAALNEIAQGLIKAQEEPAPSKSSQQDEEFMSRKQVLKYLGINSTTLWRWEKEKYLVGQTIGSRIKKYKKSDVAAILEGKNHNKV